MSVRLSVCLFQHLTPQLQTLPLFAQWAGYIARHGRLSRKRVQQLKKVVVFFWILKKK